MCVCDDEYVIGGWPLLFDLIAPLLFYYTTAAASFLSLSLIQHEGEREEEKKDHKKKIGPEEMERA